MSCLETKMPEFQSEREIEIYFEGVKNGITYFDWCKSRASLAGALSDTEFIKKDVLYLFHKRDAKPPQG